MQLEEVYGEVFRVLKPGGMFCSYEWVATKEFDPNNADHVRIIDEINFGNGLPVGFLQCMHSCSAAWQTTNFFCRPMRWLGARHRKAGVQSVSLARVVCRK